MQEGAALTLPETGAPRQKTSPSLGPSVQTLHNRRRSRAQVSKSTQQSRCKAQVSNSPRAIVALVRAAEPQVGAGVADQRVHERQLRGGSDLRRSRTARGEVRRDASRWRRSDSPMRGSPRAPGRPRAQRTTSSAGAAAGRCVRRRLRKRAGTRSTTRWYAENCRGREQAAERRRLDKAWYCARGSLWYSAQRHRSSV
jgi:hypothetical protein